MDYIEPCCPFDSSQYTGTPDTEPCAQSLNVPQIIGELDAIYERGQDFNAEEYLESWLEKARNVGDWRGELSILSELLGQYRRTGNNAAAIPAIGTALELIRLHHMGQTVSGATVMLNAATTMKCFGQAKESIPLFSHVCRVYGEHLDPMDYRFGGLYNNMALSYSDIGDVINAEKFFRLAMAVISGCENPENELAVTLCNMAEMYEKQDAEDERIGECMDRAWEYLNARDLPHNGYHAFTISKCAPTFDHFGYFLYFKILKERAEKIYAGN